MDEKITRQQLIASYRQILSDPAHRFNENETIGLSGIFLPDVTAAYCDSPVRLMLVGQETKKWNGAFQHYGIGDDFEQYLELPAKSYLDYVAKPPGRHRFLQFHRSVGKRLGRPADAVLWGNVFALSHNKATPVGCGAFSKIRDLSLALLQSQVEILKPHGILFCSGHRYDRYLKACFGSQLSGGVALEPKALWRFRVGATLCFRTSHPRYAAHNSYREHALAELVNITAT